MKKVFLVALSCMLLAACDMDFPSIESCQVGRISPSGAVIDKKALLPAQFEPLSAWFQQLGGDWKFQISDHYPTGIGLILKQRNGRSTQVTFMGNQLWIRNRVRILSISEREELLRLIGERSQLQAFDTSPGVGSSSPSK